MELREIGKTGLRTPPLILGGNVFGIGAMDQAATDALLDRFVAGGGTMIDTADIYATYVPGGKGGESETAIGGWLAARGRRDDVLIATKGSGRMGEGLSGLGPYLERALEASLRRLGTDYVDLYYAHMDDQETPQDEVADRLDRMVKSGKVRAVACSNFAPARLDAAMTVATDRDTRPYCAVQVNYSLMERGFESDLAPVCEKHGLAALPWFGLAQGYLTGKYRSADDLGKSRRGGGVKRYLEGKGPQVLAVMDAISAERGVALAAIALAWLKAHPAVVAPLASATSLAQLDEIMASMDLTLTGEEVARLNAASA